MSDNKKTGNIITGIFILAIMFFGLKGCVQNVWMSPSNPEVYVIKGQDSRLMQIVLLPKNEVMIWYSDPNKKTTEGILTKMKGSYGTHYFWRLWHIEGPGINIGYRVFPEETQPVYMEVSVLEKYMSGTENSSFADVGSTTYQLLLFGKDRIQYQDMWFTKESYDPKMVSFLLEKLNGTSGNNSLVVK